MYVFSTVPNFFVATSPAGSLQEAMVDSYQTIQCMIITVSGVKQDSIMINWIGPRGNTITNTSRITIYPLTFNDSNSTNNYFFSTLEFVHLMEGDEGSYVCNVSILQLTLFVEIELGSLTSKH